jgi:hypothetical protein
MLTIIPISKVIAIVEAERFPDLTSNGFGYARFIDPKHYSPKDQRKDREYLWSDDGLLQIAYSIQYARENRIRPDSGSYGLKHEIEIWSGDHGSYKYVCNGCAILGLSLAGYEVIVVDNSPNCRFRRGGRHE